MASRFRARSTEQAYFPISHPPDGLPLQSAQHRTSVLPHFAVVAHLAEELALVHPRLLPYFSLALVPKLLAERHSSETLRLDALGPRRPAVPPRRSAGVLPRRRALLRPGGR